LSLSQLSGIENADSPICYRTDIDSALERLQHWKTNIHVIQQPISNDISSTKIRLFLRRAMSVQYLIPAPVIEYIEANGLFEDDGASSTRRKGKSKDTESSGRASPAIGSSGSKS
jgi:nicotinamide mononucleotide adenylyltransferase